MLKNIFILCRCLLALIAFNPIGLMYGLPIAGARELKCTFNLRWCELKDKDPIHENTKNENFYFTGIRDEYKRNITVLQFYTKDVDFIPKTAFTTFPNLHTIRFYGIDMETLEFNWLERITSSFNSKIKNIYLNWSGIDKIDPQVVEIFQRYDRIDLEGNDCVNFNFHKNQGHFKLFNEKLEECFGNFVVDNPVKNGMSGSCTCNQTKLENDIEKLEKKLDESEKSNKNLREQISAGLKTLEDEMEEQEKSFKLQLKTLEEKFEETLQDEIEKNLKNKMEILENSNKIQLKAVEDKIEVSLAALGSELKKHDGRMDGMEGNLTAVELYLNKKIKDIGQ